MANQQRTQTITAMPITSSVLRIHIKHRPGWPLHMLRCTVIQPCYGNIPVGIDLRFDNQVGVDSGIQYAVLLRPLSHGFDRELGFLHDSIPTLSSDSWSSHEHDGMTEHWCGGHADELGISKIRKLPDDVTKTEMEVWSVYVGIISSSSGFDGQMVMALQWVVHNAMYDRIASQKVQQAGRKVKGDVPAMVQMHRALVIQPCFGAVPVGIDVQYSSATPGAESEMVILAVQLSPLHQKDAKEYTIEKRWIGESTKGNWLNVQKANDNYWYRKKVTGQEVMSTRGIPAPIQHTNMIPWTINVGVISEGSYNGQVMVAVHTEVHKGLYDVTTLSLQKAGTDPALAAVVFKCWHAINGTRTPGSCHHCLCASASESEMPEPSGCLQPVWDANCSLHQTFTIQTYNHKQPVTLVIDLLQPQMSTKTATTSSQATGGGASKGNGKGNGGRGNGGKGKASHDLKM
ncbi:hypothetical protein DAEQUDRAFT_742127 [Daedalea quercina L-15889]|uniref:Uncharacterized protein n=1 Tax=Daedalea quercina L-15889 TaxID=1314783 RepID=A0A165KG17_9APHY|nr:hypothetical protein DAEQUDRAFT_742127 [Daedalea quercina L-15889]